MKFSELAKYFGKLEKTASRLEMTRILAELFKEASDTEIAPICYLSLGRLTPLYESLEFQLAEKMVMRAIAQAFNEDVSKVHGMFKTQGDLGEVAEKLKMENNYASSNLGRSFSQAQNGKLRIDSSAVLEVYNSLRKIAEDSGEKSQERKVAGLVELLRGLDSLSVRYLMRMVVGKLRLGFSDKTIIDALSWMKMGDKSLRDELEKAYFVRADIGALAHEVKRQSEKVKSTRQLLYRLAHIQPELGVPVMPTLCQRLKTAKEMLDKMGKVVVEPKFDGTRVQIHLARSKEHVARSKKSSHDPRAKSHEPFLRTFTRNMEESTWMFPELTQAFDQVKARNVILDSEAVGVDPKTGKFLSFQDTMVRKRKHKVAEMSVKVPLKFFVFDVLFKDGESLLPQPLVKRRKILESLLEPKSDGPPSRSASARQGLLQLTEQVEVSGPEELLTYHSKQLKKGLEGAVVKKADSAYVPGRRAWNWVKFKEVETARGGLCDTLDCVVMGYYRGKGKRANFGIGAFLVGVRKGEQFLTIAKIGTGLSDVQWREMKKRADKERTEKQPKEYVVDKSLVPDIWVQPAIVVEIAADNLTRSPNHSAKLALRFPRLVRFRDDKRVGQATSLKEVEQMVG